MKEDLPSSVAFTENIPTLSEGIDEKDQNFDNMEPTEIKHHALKYIQVSDEDKGQKQADSENGTPQMMKAPHNEFSYLKRKPQDAIVQMEQ